MRSTSRCFAWGIVHGVAPRSRLLAVAHTAFAPCLSPSREVATSSSASALEARVATAAGAMASPLRRYVTVTRPLQQSWGHERVRPWMCIKKECRVVNKAVASQCEACGAAKPVLQRWKCIDCGTVNFAGVKECKQCKAPREKSRDFWMCAACEENNRIDELEDNSVCGFCNYDMAPRTAAQEEAQRRVQEAAVKQQLQQENYDSISYREADEQFENPLDGAQQLDASLRTSHASSDAAGCCRRLVIPKVKPFAMSADQHTATKHSSLYRRSHLNPAAKAVLEASQTPEGPPGFDWMCCAANCGHINPGDEENCLKCGAHIQPKEWECLMCGALNHLSRSRCFHCHSAIPVYWTCVACNATTSIYEKKCRSCGRERPATEPKRASEVNLKDAYGRGRVTAQRDARRGEWYCPSCHQLNYSRRSECFQCSTPRPTAGTPEGEDAFAMTGWGVGAATLSQSVASPSAAPMQNNWICTHCQASNFRTRHDCWKCGRPSEHQGEWSKETFTPQYEHEGFQTGADDKPTEGQMNANWKVNNETWTCAKCYASNFVNRLDCYRCGASKMAVMTPRRTKARRPVKL